MDFGTFVHSQRVTLILGVVIRIFISSCRVWDIYEIWCIHNCYFFYVLQVFAKIEEDSRFKKVIAISSKVDGNLSWFTQWDRDNRHQIQNREKNWVTIIRCQLALSYSYRKRSCGGREGRGTIMTIMTKSLRLDLGLFDFD